MQEQHCQQITLTRCLVSSQPQIERKEKLLPTIKVHINQLLVDLPELQAGNKSLRLCHIFKIVHEIFEGLGCQKDDVNFPKGDIKYITDVSTWQECGKQ